MEHLQHSRPDLPGPPHTTVGLVGYSARLYHAAFILVVWHGLLPALPYLTRRHFAPLGQAPLPCLPAGSSCLYLTLDAFSLLPGRVPLRWDLLLARACLHGILAARPCAVTVYFVLLPLVDCALLDFSATRTTYLPITFLLPLNNCRSPFLDGFFATCRATGSFPTIDSWFSPQFTWTPIPLRAAP